MLSQFHSGLHRSAMPHDVREGFLRDSKQTETDIFSYLSGNASIVFGKTKEFLGESPKPMNFSTERFCCERHVLRWARASPLSFGQTCSFLLGFSCIS